VNALQRAIAICGTQTELARRVKGKPASGHVHYWLQNGFDEETAIAIELAVASVIVESPAAAERARELGAVTVEQLLPDLEWHRDAGGAVTSYTKRVRRGRALQVVHGGDRARERGCTEKDRNEPATTAVDVELVQGEEAKVGEVEHGRNPRAATRVSA